MLAQVDYIPDSLGPWFDDPRWWLRSQSYQDRQILVCGIPLPEIVEHLRLVYDESACQRMLVDGYWAPLLGLFSAHCFEWFGVMIALGVDLKTLGRKRIERHFAGLRSGDQWRGSRLEVGVEAGLLRGGFTPERPRLPSNEKQWDFSIELDGTPFLIECKALSSGNADGNFALAEERFQNLFVEFPRDPNVHARLRFSPWMLRAMREHKVQMFYECVLPEFTEEFRRTLRKWALDGTPRRVGRFGSLTLVPYPRGDGFLGPWEIDGYESLLIHRMQRLMNTFGEATGNFKHAPHEAQRVAVVWTGQDYLEPAHTAELVEHNMGRSFRAHKTRLNIDRQRLGFHTGVLVEACRDFDDGGWRIERARFQTEREHGMFSDSIFEALSSWQYHVDVHRG